MSPKSGGRAQRRQRRNLWISVIAVLVIAIGSFAAVFAAKWSPRLGLDLAGGVSVVYTARGAARLAGRPRRDRQHLESPGQRARRVGRAGPDVGPEPDLGLHSRRHRRAASARPDRADGAHVLPPGRVLGLPARHPEERQRRSFRRQAPRRSPPVRRQMQLTAANLDVTPNSGPQATSTTCPRHPVRGLPVDERRQARLRHQHGAAARASAAPATARPRCAACSGRRR